MEWEEFDALSRDEKWKLIHKEIFGEAPKEVKKVQPKKKKGK